MSNCIDIYRIFGFLLPKTGHGLDILQSNRMCQPGILANKEVKSASAVCLFANVCEVCLIIYDRNAI